MQPLALQQQQGTAHSRWQPCCAGDSITAACVVAWPACKLARRSMGYRWQQRAEGVIGHPLSLVVIRSCTSFWHAESEAQAGSKHTPVVLPVSRRGQAQNPTECLFGIEMTALINLSLLSCQPTLYSPLDLALTDLIPESAEHCTGGQPGRPRGSPTCRGLQHLDSPLTLQTSCCRMALQLPHFRHLARLLPARLCSAEQLLVRRSFAATAQPAEASAEDSPGKLMLQSAGAC